MSDLNEDQNGNNDDAKKSSDNTVEATGNGNASEDANDNNDQNGDDHDQSGDDLAKGNDSGSSDDANDQSSSDSEADENAEDNKDEATDQAKEAAAEVEEEVEEEKTFLDIIKDIRVDIDKNIALAALVPRVSIFSNDAFLSKCWLGKMLSFLGGDNPYKDEDKIQSPRDIPAPADKASGQDFEKDKQNFRLLSPYQAVIQLRENFAQIIQRIDDLDLKSDEVPENADARKLAICKTQAWTHACEMRYNLGTALASIRVQ